METKNATEMLNSENEAPPAKSAGGLEGFDALAWAKARRLALAQLDQLIRLEPKVLQGDRPRAVHDFRVASRRFQQALDLLSPFLPSPETRQLRRRIRRCRRVLSKVRDTDVFIHHIEKRLRRRRAARRETWEAVCEYVRDRHKRACERAFRKLSKINLPQTYIRLKRLLEPLQAGGLRFNISFPPENDFHGQLAGELGRVWERLEREHMQSLDSPGAGNIHRVRIAAKKVRYLVEMMKEFEIPGCEEAVTWLKELQRLLGRWHDCEVAEQMMAEAAARSGFIRERLDLASGILKLISQNRKAKERLRKQFPHVALASEKGQRVTAWARSIVTSVAPVSPPAIFGAGDSAATASK